MLAMPGAHALGLGDIQVRSHLGEPLKAQVVLLNLDEADARDMKVRLAGEELYLKQGTQYPGPLKFRFDVVNRPDKGAVVHITTQQSVDELFLDVMLEVVVPSGKVTRNYTILLDPPADLIAPPVTTLQEAVPAENTVAATAAGEPVSGAGSPVAVAVEVPKPPRTEVKRRKRPPESAPRATSDVVRDGMAAEAGSEPKVKLFGKLSMTLSSSLVISRNDPTQAGATTSANDALQEELIAKEKTLEELNLQIAEMREVIKQLHLKLGTLPASAVPADEVQEQAAASAEAQAVKAPPVKVKAVVTKPASPSFMEQFWQTITAGIALIAAGIAAILWYRRRRHEGQWSYPSFDMEPHAAKAEAQESAPGVIDVTRTMGEQVLKVPAKQSQKLEVSTHPEYDLLEEADIYLRFGHENLAEEVLVKAIELNPENPHGYLTLLGIFETRGDVEAFNRLAERFKEIADDGSWMRAAEMGARLDGGNALYAIAARVSEVTEQKYRSELDEMSKMLSHHDDPFKFDPHRTH